MRAGQLRHRVTFFKKVETSDGAEGKTRSNQDVCSAWADIESLEGRELERARQVDARVTHRLRVRYQAAIGPRQFVRFKTRVFEVVAPPVNVGERNVELHVLCRESS